jgi:hemoglobin/transferrin/lactoferrin receptor protein
MAHQFAAKAATAAFLTVNAIHPAALTAGESMATDAIDEILVSSTRVRRSDSETVLPIGVLTRSDIEQRMARDIGDVLRDLPGVTTTGGPRSAAIQPNVRGMDAGRVVIRIDGARQNFQTAHRGRTFVDATLLEQVEVMRGPASTLYGSGATGGVVNMRTLDAESFLVSGQSYGLRLTTGFQYNGNERTGAATFAARGDHVGILGSISRARADDFRDGSGRDVAVTGLDQFGALIKGTWDLRDRGRVTVTHTAFRDDGPSLNTPDRATGTLVERETRQGSSTLNYRFGTATSTLSDGEVTLYHNRVALVESTQVKEGLIAHDVTTRGVDVQNTTHVVWAGLDHEVTYGAEYYEDEQAGTENGLPRQQFANSSQRVRGAFVQNRSTLGARVELTVGVRHDNLRQRAERDGTAANTLSATSLLASGAYAVTPSTRLYATYAEAFRAPSLRELYIGGQHFPGNNYVPNPALRPESAHNVEAGLLYLSRGWLAASDQLTIRLSAFQNDVEDFINQVVDGSTATTRFENVADARFRGVESALDYRAPRYRVTASASLLRGDDRGSGWPLESIAADRLALGGAWRWLRGRLETGSRIELNRDQNRLWVGPHTRSTTPGYTLVDLYARWQPTPSLRVDARINNVFDQAHRHHLAFVNGRGRTARLQLSYQPRL